MLSAIPGVIASLIGASLVIRIPQQYLFKALGTMLLLYVIFIYSKPSFRLRPTKLYAITGGAFAGFISGLLGVSGEVTPCFSQPSICPRLFSLELAEPSH